MRAVVGKVALLWLVLFAFFLSASSSSRSSTLLSRVVVLSFFVLLLEEKEERVERKSTLKKKRKVCSNQLKRIKTLIKIFRHTCALLGCAPRRRRSLCASGRVEAILVPVVVSAVLSLSLSSG